MEKYVAITVDVDAIAGWLGSYGGEDSLCDLSRGEFAGKIGTMRLLELFDSMGIKTTWFTPGHSIETFWNQMKKVVDSGHEIGLHGYSHENPSKLSREQESKIFDKNIALVEKLTGERPIGNRQPWWDMGESTIDLMIEKGLKYDSSMMGEEFHPYRLRKGDTWSKIDYDKDPETWMRPYKFGEETNIVEFPVSWYLDDLPAQMFMKHPYYNYGWTHPDIVYKVMFKEHFDWLIKKEKDGILTLTVHPDVSGRVQGLKRLEELLSYMKTFDVKFVTLREALKVWS
ncbi:4-deoxy-4-formamido-L-arabinose-phosphoundecaprenol deformylase ArnD [Sulfuracidifex tepidarius]|uniref:4-deoxy-4-formamido-L-arabinose-phosphoundecaprenol deformylase ArnD n=3 Tax=Sulfuracidifex tepidarius TaxID=1294262 RepID=A0A510DY22_9CREN|nr:4-deoxy-4-formamido-L-arabinose-phosphoundecaprenol deformylase ArnD [Sulfuracidifex tepidarius]